MLVLVLVGLLAWLIWVNLIFQLRTTFAYLNVEDYHKLGDVPPHMSPYYRDAATDLQTDTIVASVVRASFSETWPAGFTKAFTRFVSTHNVETAQSELAAACKRAKICK